MKNIHVLGIGGTFMGGLALLAKAQGFHVSGADEKIYPPMSLQLEAEGIRLIEGYHAEQLHDIKPDAVIIGNAMTRGKHPVLEPILNQAIPYFSGPEWIARHVLSPHHVIAVAGTHGKTTTAAMIAFILDRAGLSPGFLIGGVPHDFGVSAQKGNGNHFVIEADEYDTAFFDKRPKFMHYRPRTLVLNNLEYDHADIYPNLTSIQQQFTYLLRTVPSQGRIIAHYNNKNLRTLLNDPHKIFTPVDYFGKGKASPKVLWEARPVVSKKTLPHSSLNDSFDVYYKKKCQGRINWMLMGDHYRSNALAAIAAAHLSAGVPIAHAIETLSDFKGVKRRMDIKIEKNGLTVYEDFAHHPTAIAATLAGLRQRIGTQRRLVCVLECASHSMRMGVHNKKLAGAWQTADAVLLLKPAHQKETKLTLDDLAFQSKDKVKLFSAVDAMVEHLRHNSQSGDCIVIMSNQGFGGMIQKLLSVF